MPALPHDRRWEERLDQPNGLARREFGTANRRFNKIGGVHAEAGTHDVGSKRQWIPAFAGMTMVAFAGMTMVACAGMTMVAFAGMTMVACAGMTMVACAEMTMLL